MASQTEREATLNAAWREYIELMPSSDLRRPQPSPDELLAARQAINAVARAAGREKLEEALRVFQSAVSWLERICEKYDPDDEEDWRQQLLEYREAIGRALLTETTEGGSGAAAP